MENYNVTFLPDLGMYRVKFSDNHDLFTSCLEEAQLALALFSLAGDNKGGVSADRATVETPFKGGLC